jgi:hypothetical protein
MVAGVPEPYNIHARENEDTAVLSITKDAFNGVIAAYPEQNDIIMTNMLLQYGLSRDGEDIGGGAMATQGEDEAFAQMREDIIVRVTACVPVQSLSVTCQKMLHSAMPCACSWR